MTDRGRRYLFIGGLHRSGTTLVADLIAAAPGIAAIGGAPVPEQEGVYLQGGIPHGRMHGRPGEFAFDPDQHLTEQSRYNRFDVARRIAADWDRWFPPEPTFRIEKSPVNLLRSRLYQQLFPPAMFVFVVRHPVAVARATAKWSSAGLPRLMEHWERAHALLLEDLPHLHCHLIVRYEDLVADPAEQLRRIGAFTDLCVPPPGAVVADRNREYLTSDEPDVGPVARSFGYGRLSDAPSVAGISMGSHHFRHVAERIG